MKMIIAILMLSSSVSFALDMADLKNQAAPLAEKAKAQMDAVMAACKEDKVKYCDKYTEFEALKACFVKNKTSLTAGCKASLGLK